MIQKFIPKVYQKDVFRVNYKSLKEKGIKLLIFDLDNTLSLISETVPSNEIKNLIMELSKDFQILVASNNKKKRVELFCAGLECKYLASCCKPLKRKAYYIKKNYSLSFNEIAVIGDQLVTDILFGNRCGMYTVLVDPKGEKDLKITCINRYLEAIIKRKLNFKKGVYYEKD